MTYFHDFYRELEDGTEQKVTVEYEATPYIPAQTYGPAEDCYPAEGGEVEIIKAWLEPQSIEIELPDAEREKWELWLMENPERGWSGDDDYDDGDY